jgi:hypothetical protein
MVLMLRQISVLKYVYQKTYTVAVLQILTRIKNVLYRIINDYDHFMLHIY